MKNEVNDMSFEEFEAYLKRTKKTESTRKVYLSNLELIERFLGKKLDKHITKKDIQRFLDSISDQASNTIIMKMMILRLYFKWLYEMKRGYPDIVDFDFPRKKSNNLTPDDLLTEEEVLKLINALNDDRLKLIEELKPKEAELPKLTDKQQKVFDLMKEGKTIKEIAEASKVSFQSIYQTIRAIKLKGYDV